MNARPALWIAVAAVIVAAVLLVRMQMRAPAASAPDVAAAPVPEQAGLAPKPVLELRERNTTGATEYLVRNLLGGPIEVRCALRQAVNARTDPPLPRRLVVPAQAEQLVAEFQVVDPALPHASGQVECQGMLGDPRANPPMNVRYALPFAPGTKFTLDQGFGGRFSHADAENYYALDFGVPEGTPVLAARAGVVVQVEEDFRAHGLDARFADRANYVRVLHDDGSIALYAHLAPASMLRRAGDRVVVGQMVGKSGNTGMSSGPHLHFAVQRNAGMRLVSLPFEVEGVDLASARRRARDGPGR
jgi:murein DD-endopeptidase MepM/ murein hydrolase activator NlpD